MKILFTGGSSFTGFWFICQLIKAGYEVDATFTGSLQSYAGLRRRRIEKLLSICKPVYNAPFGSDNFISTVQNKKYDILCHHGAYVRDYKSDDFDLLGAVATNTKNLRRVLNLMKERGLKRVLLTGSVFEPDEGAGNSPLAAFSPYGLSKGMTADIFRYWCHRLQLPLGKFVIPNPFGPYEEPRFTYYLMDTWSRGGTAVVKTPEYVRDNIHVSLLARIYVSFIQGPHGRINPSGYVEKQGAFAERFASEMRERLSLKCRLKLQEQTDFPEPKIRINTEVPDVDALDWDEKEAWDEVAEYYRYELWGEQQRVIGL